MRKCPTDAATEMRRSVEVRDNAVLGNLSYCCDLLIPDKQQKKKKKEGLFGLTVWRDTIHYDEEGMEVGA